MDMFRQWKRGDYQKIYEMEHTRKKKRGGPKATWAEGIRGLMGERD